MKTYRVILFSVALCAGGIAAWLALATPPTAALSAEQEIVKVDVLVAVEDAGQGSVLQETTMQWQSWPLDAVKPFFITRPAQPGAITELTGSILRSPINAGEFIHAEKIAPAGSGFLSAVLSSGRRAVAVRVSAESSAGGFIRPNDRVDVLHTAPCTSQEGCQSGNEVHTILKAVRVLAIDQIGMRDDAETVSVGKTGPVAQISDWDSSRESSVIAGVHEQPTSPTHKTRNWPACNEALKRRGPLMIWFDPDMTWDATPSGKRDRQVACGDAAIQTRLTMKVLFGMALRQTTGFVESLLRLLGLDWTVPDFSTLGRRQKALAVNIPYRGSKGPLHLLIDSAGIKVEGEGERHAR